MADIKLRIELNPNAGEESLGNITNYNEVEATNDNLSNTSLKADENGVFQNISKATGNGSNGLTWAYGELKFDENGFLDNIEESGAYLESEQNPTQFFWGVVPEDTKYYYVRLDFTNANSLKELTILGDRLTNQFPTRAILDGSVEVFSDDPEWNIEFPTESDTHTIEFTHWNRGNYNATITKIAVLGQYLYVDKTNGLKSVETLTQSSSSPSDIFYGVLPNSGSAELLDSNGELHDMIVDGVISDSKVKIDVLANGNVVGTHYTEDTNYDNHSKIVSFDMGDGLADWDSLIYSGYDLVEGSKTAYQMLLSVFESLGYDSTQVDKMLETEIIYGNDNVIGSVKSYLEQIVIQYPYLLSDTYRNTINKFCTLAQLQLLQMDNGELKFVSARPIATTYELENTIQVNAKDQFSTFDRTAIVKNKATSVNVNISNTSIEDKTIYQSKGIVVEGSNPNPRVVQSLDSNMSFFSNWGYYDKEIINYTEDGLANKIVGAKANVLFELDLSSLGDVFYKDVSRIYLIAHNTKNTYKRSIDINGQNYDSETTETEDVKIVPIQASILKNILLLKFSIDIAQYYSGVLTADNKFSNYLSSTITFDLHAECITSTNEDLYFGVETKNKGDFSVEGNEMLQFNTVFNNTNLSKIIAQNILNDYSNGIADGVITISCADYYNENGDKVKDWASGQIIEVGDIIAPKKDNLGTPLVNYRNGNEYKWRVKGATFRKGGIPFLDLQVQEIRQP